ELEDAGKEGAAPQGAAPEDKRKHAERVQLVRAAESLARSEQLVHAPEQAERQLAELERSWAELGEPGDAADLATRFRRACARARKQLEAHAELAARKAQE